MAKAHWVVHRTRAAGKARNWLLATSKYPASVWSRAIWTEGASPFVRSEACSASKARRLERLALQAGQHLGQQAQVAQGAVEVADDLLHRPAQGPVEGAVQDGQDVKGDGAETQAPGGPGNDHGGSQAVSDSPLERATPAGVGLPPRRPGHRA